MTGREISCRHHEKGDPKYKLARQQSDPWLFSSGRPTTTGNKAFAECKLLCRVSKTRHSTKTFLAECRTRQRIALGKEFFAEILCRVPGTRQKKALGKGLLCRVPGSRQKRGTRHRLSHVMMFGHVLLCRVPVIRHSAKF